jgi:hypothetical protein
MGHDVVHTSCEGPNWTYWRTGGCVADAAALCPILVIRDAHDGGGSQIEGEEWGGIGYDRVR